MIVKTESLEARLRAEIDSLVVPWSSRGEVRRRFRGSFFRKRLLSPVTDADVEVAVCDLCKNTARVVAVARAVCAAGPAKSRLRFLFAECGSAFAVPWVISESGILEQYDQQKAEEWYARVEAASREGETIDSAAARRVAACLQTCGQDRDPVECGAFRVENVTARKLARVELATRASAGTVWSLSDLEAAQTDGTLLALLSSGNTLFFEFAFLPDDANGDFFPVQVAFVDGTPGAPRGGRERPRVAHKHLAEDIPAVFKDARWNVREKTISGDVYAAAAEAVEWPLAIRHRARLAWEYSCTGKRRRTVQLSNEMSREMSRDISRKMAKTDDDVFFSLKLAMEKIRVALSVDK